MGVLVVIAILILASGSAFALESALQPDSSSSSGDGGISSDFELTVVPFDVVAAVAQQAGFSGDDLVTAVAVALAESGGNANAYNPETAAGTPQGQGSYGLWQIYLKAHPEFAGMNLFDPETNANAAFLVYSNAGGFTPWSAFKNGAYRAHLDDAAQRVNA